MCLFLPLISRAKISASQFVTLRSHSISSRVAHEIIFLGKRKRFARSFPSSSSRGSSSRNCMIVCLEKMKIVLKTIPRSLSNTRCSYESKLLYTEHSTLGFGKNETDQARIAEAEGTKEKGSIERKKERD